MEISRRVSFSVRLRVPVLDVRMRSGEFLEGEHGWGEYSPLPSWDHQAQVLALAAATEAATQPFPDPVRKLAKINAMIPRIAPAEAAALAVASGCSTVKVKVGDPAGIDRVAAVRETLGAAARIRLDANGAWHTVEQACEELRRFEPFSIELIEDPVADIESLAEMRSRQPVPIAAESCLRNIEDVRALTRADAADAIVLKPQRFGGVRACLEAADEFGGPVIASSALETSVGLSAVLALALSLPLAPYAHGIGTQMLLETDPSESFLAPIGGSMTGRRVAPAADLLNKASKR